MIVTTRIPTHRNNKKKVGKRELHSILKRVRTVFGGYTFEGPSEGAWIAPDGQVHEEMSYRLEVFVARNKWQKHVSCLKASARSSVSEPSSSKFARVVKSLVCNEENGDLACRSETSKKTRKHYWR